MTEVCAPMAGNIWKLECRQGERVQDGDVVIIMEAMKMETELFAPASGVVREIRVQEGQSVEEDDVLLVIEPA
ncbi:MAG: hypothetical protein Kow0092_11010 [Deferrisomatales bacterium]